ncbi:MAG: gliding motility-associated C-terminal domain-containing protein, partial [Vicingaceae bacterium]
YNFTPTTGCNTNATMDVAVRAYTTPTFTQVGPYCVGDTPPNLLTTSDNGIAGTWDATISTAAAGTITYNFTSDQGQCAFDTTTIITTNDLPIITTSNDTSICINQTANLFATGAVTYVWNNSVGNGQLQTVLPNETTTYVVIGTDINGCSSTNTILVTIDNSICFNIPNVFSPNGDGKNDTWVLRGMEDYSDATIAIFNRWGSEIFNTSDTQNFWDGTYNGTDSPSATYYYFIDLGDGSDPINGTVNIIR